MLLKITLVTVQAEVDGQKITWLAPHARQQVLTDDVDFNVMLTFLEFYEVTSLPCILVCYTDVESFALMMTVIYRKEVSRKV